MFFLGFLKFVLAVFGTLFWKEHYAHAKTVNVELDNRLTNTTMFKNKMRIGATKLQRLCNGFKRRKKTDFRIELFENHEQ